jgi:flagellar basal-body rod protein FlgF
MKDPVPPLARGLLVISRSFSQDQPAMENTSYIALSRQAALWRQMEVVANNMANANTPAYKNEQVMFVDHLVNTKSDTTPFGRKLSYVQDYGLLRDTREGPLTTTNEPLDVALHGDGYFVVDTPAGPRYTRDGHFQLDETGMMVTSSGYPVLQANNQPVVFAPTERHINISGNGTISTENGTIGSLQVVNFGNQQVMQKVGDGLYETSAQPTAVEQPQMIQGMLEQSNVQTLTEVTNMMTILRNYEGVQNLIDSENTRQTKALQTLSQSQSKS